MDEGVSACPTQGYRKSDEGLSMTATIHHLSTSPLSNSTEDSTINLSKAAQTNVSLGEEIKVRQQIISGLNSTNLNIETIDANQVKDASVERIYPHVFDEDAATGQVRNNILNALDNAQDALDFYSVPDLESMSTKITVIAVIMRSTHLLTEFNESLGAVVSFLRRATLNTPSEEMNRSALNALVNALQLIATNPMIDLDEACDLIDKLSNDGWRGEHGVAEELVAMLFDELDIENNDELQGGLFAELQTGDTQDEEL